MKRSPVPRQGVYELYRYFASERQRTFERRIAGKSYPWTDDPILQTYKFCNVYRAADRVSQYMISEICYHNEPCAPEDRLFQIVAFRTFSKIETWRSVHAFLGHYPTLDDLGDGSFTKALNYAKQKMVDSTREHLFSALLMLTASRSSTSTMSSYFAICFYMTYSANASLWRSCSRKSTNCCTDIH